MLPPSIGAGSGYESKGPFESVSRLQPRRRHRSSSKSRHWQDARSPAGRVWYTPAVERQAAGPTGYRGGRLLRRKVRGSLHRFRSGEEVVRTILFIRVSSVYCMALWCGRSLSLEPYSSVRARVPFKTPAARSLTSLTGTRHILVDQSVNCMARFARIPIISARTLSGWKSPVEEWSVSFTINKDS